MKKGKKLNRKKGGPEHGGSEVKKGGCKCWRGSFKLVQFCGMIDILLKKDLFVETYI